MPRPWFANIASRDNTINTLTGKYAVHAPRAGPIVVRIACKMPLEAPLITYVQNMSAHNIVAEPLRYNATDRMFKRNRIFVGYANVVLSTLRIRL